MLITLRVLHFIGLAMGFSVSFANIIMSGLIAAAPPGEKPVLGRFPMAMMRIGDIGLALLWTTGPALLYIKYGGFSGMPWQFHVKLTAVVLLTLVVGFMHSQKGRIRAGDAAAMDRMKRVAPLASLSALTALIFAVRSFNR
jgi:hypothetical protein